MSGIACCSVSAYMFGMAIRVLKRGKQNYLRDDDEDENDNDDDDVDNDDDCDNN